MMDNSKYLPIEECEHDFVHDLGVIATLGWQATPVWDSMSDWWYTYFNSKTLKELRIMFRETWDQVSAGGVSRLHKSTLVGALAMHWNTKVSA